MDNEMNEWNDMENKIMNLNREKGCFLALEFSVYSQFVLPFLGLCREIMM